MTRLTGILCIIAAFALSAPDVQAQHHVIGSSWSFSGIGISYEYHKDTQTFAQVDVRAEMFDTFIGVSTKPGGSASFTWNIVFSSMQSRNDIEVRFYAGPGVAVGYAEDYKTPENLREVVETMHKAEQAKMLEYKRQQAEALEYEKKKKMQMHLWYL